METNSIPKRRGARPGERRGGRQKGTPNKVTAAARELFNAFVDGNTKRLQKLFDEAAKGEPARAIEILLRAREFVYPKLTRTEYTGRGGGPVQMLNIETNDPIEAARIYLEMIKDA